MANAAVPEPAPNRPAGRVPPHNVEAEESLLGAMLLSKDAVAEATETVAAEDFYKPAHAQLFAVIQALYARGEPVDPVTVADALRRDGALDRFGGKQTILRIQAATPAAANAGWYARIVADHALLRRLMAVGSQIAELALEAPDDLATTVDRAESLVFEVANRRMSGTMRGIHPLLAQTLDDIEAQLDRAGGLSGVACGFTDLDHLLLGLQPSNLIVVAARPGQGKTAFALGAAAHVAAIERRPVVLFSLEMSASEISQRLLAAEAGVNSRLIRTGRLSDGDWADLSRRRRPPRRRPAATWTTTRI